ncbi:MAG: ISL3 family transposase [Caldisericia bacterium]|nr:ISL3 family transposase [Caldisericia bacterium]
MKKEFILKLLNLNNNYNIIEVKEEELMNVNKITLVDIDLKFEKIRKNVICPRCGSSKLIIHSRDGKRRILHLIQENGKRVYLNIPKVRFKCKDCNKTFTYYPDNLHPWMRISDNLLLSSIYNLRRNSFREVSKFYGVHIRTLKKYLNKFVKKTIPWDIFKETKELRFAIDEHSVSGKRKKVVLIVELNTHTPITILKGDKKEDIINFFNSIPKDLRNKIKEISIDMRESFRRGIIESLGDKVKISVDPFHLIRDANRRIDDERTLIQNTLSFYERRVIKIPKIIFVKGKERLSDKEKERINNYFNEYPSLKELYLIKEKLRDMYLNMKNDKRENVEKYLNELIVYMKNSKESLVRVWCKTLIKWRNEILNHFDNLSSTSMVEGYNNVSKLIKRISFGIKDINIYTLKVFLGIVPFKVLPHILT